MNKEELKDAIASGSCLRKMDAGRFGSPQSSNSTSPRSTLANVAAAWNTLTESEQQSWNDVAVGFPFKNKFGDIYTGSGYQVFMKLNSNLALINMDLLKSGPVANFPILPPIVPPSGDPPELLKFTFVGGIPAGISILVYACAPVLRGSSFRKGKEKLLMAAPSNATGVINCTYWYQNLFGQVKPNSKIFFRFVAVSETTGQVSVENILQIDIPQYIPVPKVGFYIPGYQNFAISSDKDWIVPFRVYGFNLTENLVIDCPIDAFDHFKIGRSLTGPWVNSISVPLNELHQPKQSVFYIKIRKATPGLIGTAISVNSLGATLAVFGIGVEAITQFIGDPVALIQFNDVYTGVYTPLEIAMPYGALRSDLTWFLTGANADRFELSPTEQGPWLSSLDQLGSGTGSDAANTIWMRVKPGATGALVATLNVVAGGDLTPTFTVNANCIDGTITSPQSGGIAYGNAIVGERNDGVLQLSAAGLATLVGIFTDTLVNCTVEFSEVFAGIYSDPLTVSSLPPTITNKTIYYSIIPTGFGAFSANINFGAGGTSGLVIALSGTGV